MTATVLSSALGCDECGQQYWPANNDHPGEPCRVCSDDGFSDPYEDGIPVIVAFDIDTDMVALARRIRDFYDMDGMSTGGPLHIVTDDNNVEDSHLAFCREAVEKPDGWWRRECDDVDAMTAQATAILDGLAPLTLAQRGWVCSFWYKLARP